MPRRVSSPEFIGREQELAALIEGLDRAGSGEFAAVFLAGDSGVGKSRLLGELERAAAEREARVLVGECIDLAEGELPYAPIRTALRRLAGELDQQELDEALGPGRDELARIVPDLSNSSAGRVPGSGRPREQARLFELLLGVLGRLGEDAPVLLAIEDVHWADRSTLEFIAFLLTNARRERLLLVCSYRTDELHRRHPLRPFLARHERPLVVERVELRPFTTQELGAQLQGILGSTPAPELVDRLHERTEGNAFFTEELLAASEEGTELPASLRDALMLRIEALPERSRRVLRTAAAHGRYAPHRLLAAVCELSEQELDAALREALARHVLIQPDAETYAFRHALLQETLEADLLPGERTGLHLALAEALEANPRLVSRDGRSAAEIYSHWLGAHKLPEALGAAVRAGIEAEELYAYGEASNHYERALELWDRVDDAEERAGMDEAALYARAAESAHLSGDGPAAIRLARAAVERLDPRADPYRAALVKERLGLYLFLFSGDAEGAHSAYQEAVDLLPADQPRQELARVLAALAQILMLRGRTAESVERCEQAIAVARQVGARAEEGHALNTLGSDLADIGDRMRGIERLREALSIAEELEDVDGLGRAYVNLGDCLDQDGQIAAAVEVARAGAARAGEIGMREWRLLLEAEAATRAFKLGSLEEAARLTEAAREMRPSQAKFAQCSARARVEIQRRRAREAELLLGAAEDATADAPASTWIEPLASARVELELLRSRPEEARLLGDRELERLADHEKVFFTARLHALTARADAELAERARAEGDHGAAAAATGRATALVERIDARLDPALWVQSPPPESLAHRDVCVAEAARAAGTATASDWAAVADRWTEMGMPLEEGYGRLREAERLVLDGKRELATEVVTAAQRMADESGAGWLREELDSLARRGRLGVAAEAQSAETTMDDAVERLGLTAREREVLELVAQGMTNRQIGDALFMSQRTASVHVSRILAKLEVSSRVEAATAAQRLGLVD